MNETEVLVLTGSGDREDEKRCGARLKKKEKVPAWSIPKRTKPRF